jgi:mono/diheme cytochrome c family protein
MDLHSKVGWFRAAGLALSLGLVACDGGADTKAEDAKKAEAAKADEKKAAPADLKAADPAKADEKKADAANPDIKAADAADPDAKAPDAATPDAKGADAKATDTKGADAKATDTKGADAKATDTKTADKKGTDAKKDAPKVAAIDGKPLYEAKCKSCHALDGKGTEAMKKKKVPDMTDKAWQTAHSKAKIADAITNGIAGTPMKPFKDKLKPEEIDAIATYVKKLK